MRNYFLSTGRIGFSLWQDSDLSLAKLLLGDPALRSLFVHPVALVKGI